MRKISTIICLAAALLICIFVISGCNTVEGLGKDIERSGEVIQDVAN